MNPTILAAELLELAGIGQYPQVKRFTGMKGKHYTDTIALMWRSTFPAATAAPVMQEADP